MSIFTELAGERVLLEPDKNYYTAPAVTYGYKVAATATNCVPRRLVAKDENDLEIKLAGANDAVLGVLGFEYTPGNCKRLKSINDNYAPGDYAPVIVERGKPVTLVVAPEQYVSLGDKLYTSDLGCVAVTGTVAVGVALETLLTGVGERSPIKAIFN